MIRLFWRGIEPVVPQDTLDDLLYNNCAQHLRQRRAVARCDFSGLVEPVWLEPAPFRPIERKEEERVHPLNENQAKKTD